MRSRWPCGRRTAELLGGRDDVAAVRTNDASTVRRRAGLGMARSSGRQLGQLGVEAARRRQGAAALNGGRPRRPAQRGRRRPGPAASSATCSEGGSRRPRVGEGHASAHVASASGVASGWSAPKTPKKPVGDAGPGASVTGSSCRADQRCARAAGGGWAARRVEASATARRRAGALRPAGARRSPSPALPRSADHAATGRRAGHVLPDRDGGARARTLHRGEVQVLADVVLVGPHRADGARPGSCVRTRSTVSGLGRPCWSRHVPEPGGRARAEPQGTRYLSPAQAPVDGRLAAGPSHGRWGCTGAEQRHPVALARRSAERSQRLAGRPRRRWPDRAAETRPSTRHSRRCQHASW